MVNGVERGQVGKKLPKGWKRVSLGDLCTIQNGYAFKSSTFVKQGIPVIKMGNIAKDCRLKWNPELLSYLPESHLSLHSEFVIAKNDLLITLTDMSPSGEYLGTVAMYDQNIPALLNQRVGKFISISNELDIRYLYFRLCTKDFKRYATCDNTGNLRKNTNPEYLQKYKFSLPPLPEQKRIVGILSDRLSTIDKARAAAAAQLKAAKALPATYLRQVFDSPEAQKWKEVTIDDISSFITDGPHITPTYVSKGIPFLTIRNIVKRKIDLSQVSYISEEDHSQYIRRVKAEKGDILYTKDGTLGVPCVVDTDLEFSFFVSVAIIKLLKDRANPYFIAFALDSPQVLKQVEQLGAGAGLKHMVIRSIKALKVRLPSTKEQEKIVRQLSEKMLRVEQLQQSLQSQLHTINKLPAALLRQAFNGEL